MMGCQNLRAYETWLPKLLVNLQFSSSLLNRINNELSLGNVNITTMI